MKKNRKKSLLICFGMLCLLGGIVGVCFAFLNFSNGKKETNSYVSGQAESDSFLEVAREKEEIQKEHTLQDKREELVENKGLYMPDSIVLENTTREEAERIAGLLGAKCRTTQNGDYAVLYSYFAASYFRKTAKNPVICTLGR